jgi:hypothetical protein
MKKQDASSGREGQLKSLPDPLRARFARPMKALSQNIDRVIERPRVPLFRWNLYRGRASDSISDRDIRNELFTAEKNTTIGPENCIRHCQTSYLQPESRSILSNFYRGAYSAFECDRPRWRIDHYEMACRVAALCEIYSENSGHSDKSEQRDGFG